MHRRPEGLDQEMRVLTVTHTVLATAPVPAWCRLSAADTVQLTADDMLRAEGLAYLRRALATVPPGRPGHELLAELAARWEALSGPALAAWAAEARVALARQGGGWSA